MKLRIGVILRTDVDGIYVAFEDLDPDLEWGPLEAVMASTTTLDVMLNYVAGKRVLVGTLGSIVDDYIVLGPIMETGTY